MDLLVWHSVYGMATYGDRASSTPKMLSAQPIRAPLFKVTDWANGPVIVFQSLYTLINSDTTRQILPFHHVVIVLLICREKPCYMSTRRLLLFVQRNLCFFKRGFLCQHLCAYGSTGHTVNRDIPGGVGRGFSMELTPRCYPW